MSEESRRSRTLRLALGAGAVLIILIVAGVIAYLAYRESRNGPLQVKLYPGARQVSSEAISAGHDHQVYVSTDSAEEIERFYAGQKGVECEPQYASVTEQPGGELSKEGYLYTRCIKDRSSLNMTQYTVILIQPNTTGEVIIDIDRHWD